VRRDVRREHALPGKQRVGDPGIDVLGRRPEPWQAGRHRVRHRLPRPDHTCRVLERALARDVPASGGSVLLEEPAGTDGVAIEPLVGEVVEQVPQEGQEWIGGNDAGLGVAALQVE
jgi:hypothetical protein